MAGLPFQVVQCQVIETLERLFRLFDPVTVEVPFLVQNLLVIVAKVVSLQVRDKKTHSLKSATITVRIVKIACCLNEDVVFS